MESGRSNKNAARYDVQEHEQEQIAKAFDRQNVLGEEITLPQRGGVYLEKLIPRGGTAFRSRVKPVFLEDVLNRILRNCLDSQFAELPRIRV